MPKQKENIFREKFRLLSSQDYVENINWSSSDCSDYEEPNLQNKLNNFTNKGTTIKRKRKVKVPKNISNLSITILDTSRDGKSKLEKSPILNSRNNQTKCSPILNSKKTTKITSPIIAPKNLQQKSPILPTKNSPKCAVKVRKKLFGQSEDKMCNVIKNKQMTTAVSNPLLNCELKIENSEDMDIILPSGQIKVKLEDECKSKQELINKVRFFFDSHFSSENSSQASQVTISEISTPNNSKKSEELDILSCKSQVSPKMAQIKQESYSSYGSENTDYTNKRPKKYKKNGLAYRLDNLLKLQNSSCLIWQHERYLAAHSNFILPKEEHAVFRIQNVNSQYGCHLIEAMDENDHRQYLLINDSYATSALKNDSIIKVYEPYHICKYENLKILINIHKFEVYV